MCDRIPSSPQQTLPPVPESEEYTPPPPPDFGEGEAPETPESKALAEQVATVFGETFHWPDAGDYQDITGIYGTGTGPALTIQVVTSLTADPTVDDPHAADLCLAVGSVWRDIGSPTGWNRTVVRGSDGGFMATCANFGTG